MAARITLPALAVYCIKAIVFICDIITFPVFFFLDKPWNRWKINKIVWAQLEDENDPYSSYVRKNGHPDSHIGGHGTMAELFKGAVSRYGGKRCFGRREVLGEEEVTVKSGKVFKKLLQGEYTWKTYNEIDQRVEDVGKGLLSLGIQSRKPVVILAETRVEWNIAAQACFRINVPVVTLYATLGEDGLVHGINETEVTHIITSVDLLPKLKNVLNRSPLITHVVYMEGLAKPSIEGIPKNIKMISFSDMEDQGRKATDVSFTPPEPEDLAILMYTSGSTGVPKGVMVTNRNVITTVKGFNDVIGVSQLRPDDIYIAYLPVAHVLELAAECYVLSLGFPIGFSSPQTLTDFSTAVKKGASGDLKALQPTLMASVPLMMDRIRKSILQLAGKEGSFARLMFDFAIEYKNFWSRKGFQTPMLDSKLLKTYHDFMGGQLRIVMSGGAPISPDTQNFIRSCLNVNLLQGYGMTETAASSTLMAVDDFSTGRVGAPLSTCKLRLVDWEEGSYYATDRPHPRGEIVVGGDCVTLGYFKNEPQTLECFRQDAGGTRWFHTGDIGEVHPDGTFQIIDRKKDLVKLQFGEYVALGKVESELKTCPLVENICVVGDSLRTFLVALVVPNQQELRLVAAALRKGALTFEQMCVDAEITAVFTQRIKEYAKQCRLFGSEVPAKMKLCSEEWAPDTGLVTAAFKLRRKVIEEHYKDSIEAMYHDGFSAQNGSPAMSTS